MGVIEVGESEDLPRSIALERILLGFAAIIPDAAKDVPALQLQKSHCGRGIRRW